VWDFARAGEFMDGFEWRSRIIREHVFGEVDQ
jgi:hypothetical protein